MNHWWAQNPDPVAFLKCARCGLEHSLGRLIGRPGERSGDGGWWCRYPGKDWQRRDPPYRTPPCPGKPPEPVAVEAPA